MSSIESAVANDHSSRPTPRSAAIGFWKMPKLWRAPMPMVRITAPLITATQKLRGDAEEGEADATIEGPRLLTCLDASAGTGRVEPLFCPPILPSGAGWSHG